MSTLCTMASNNNLLTLSQAIGEPSPTTPAPVEDSSTSSSPSDDCFKFQESREGKKIIKGELIMIDRFFSDGAFICEALLQLIEVDGYQQCLGTKQAGTKAKFYKRSYINLFGKNGTCKK